MNCLGVFLKILKFLEWNKDNFKILRDRKGELSQKWPEPNMWLLVNHTKPTITVYWSQYHLTAGNYKSTDEQLQNDSVNSAMMITIKMLITINLVIIKAFVQ